MSPFSDALRKLRFRHGLRQQELAELVGCDRSYVSALENDLKHAPSAEFVRAVSQSLNLAEEDAETMERARARSKRAYVIPVDTPMQAYELVFELFERLESLSSAQVRAMHAVLELRESAIAPKAAVEGRIRRSDRQLKNQEGAM